MARLVVPQNLRGFRDLLPEEMSLRNAVVEKIRTVYETYGFFPIDTPILEQRATLLGTGGEETDKLIFFLDTPEKQRAGLRFDLTVPFARIIAQYHPNDLRLPFRRYHVGPVFRADEPQVEQGRFRQFTQFDIDIAGTRSIAADAEVVAAMGAAMRAVGLTDDPGQAHSFFLRLSNRRLIDAFLAGIEIGEPERARHVMRVIDKRDKIKEQDLVRELGNGRRDESGSMIAGVGLTPTRIDQILGFVTTTGSSRREVLTAVDKIISPSEAKDAAIAEITTLIEHLEALGVSEGAARLDPSLTRGLDYYTGTVMEASLPHAGIGSSIGGGGRYDTLVSRFQDEPIPGIGVSIGLERLVIGLRALGLDAAYPVPGPKVIVLVMPKVSEAEASRVAAQLRAGGIATELYVGEAAGVSRQLAYANARGLAVAVMVGGKEAAQGVVTIKDLREGDEARRTITDNEAYRKAGSAGQRVVPRDDLVAAVRELLVP